MLNRREECDGHKDHGQQKTDRGYNVLLRSGEAPFLGILRSEVLEISPRLRPASCDLRRSSLRLTRLPSFWLRKRITTGDTATTGLAY